ncbi:MAG TPA: class I SAM-dependent methyltransferase [Acidobacteriota bacterium]|nr:class I SAM-dependent methyltransferase [Acidobacteriota bacterium]
METPLVQQEKEITKGSFSGAVCRFCGSALKHTLVDLGMSPLCESYLSAEELNRMEPFYPLHVFICDQCYLAQLEEYVSPENIFSHYAYFSSYSDTWLDHARRYCEMAIKRFQLNANSFVVEVASNDGYLLQNFVTYGIPVLGIEPAANVAEAALKKGVDTLVTFFSENSARELTNKRKKADLIIGNNVLAQVPALNDFVAGLKILLASEGVITLEFPHLFRLIEGNQFDTIYHEHFSYFSFFAIEKIFEKHALKIFDVEELPTHGGSLRIFGNHKQDLSRTASDRVTDLRSWEESKAVNELKTYENFAEQVRETKRALLQFLIEAKRSGKTIAGYGAPGKGNTLLNYCAIRTDFLDYTVDRSPFKQGKFLPGTHVPIYHPDQIRKTKPDYLLILPWNLKEEISKQMSYIRQWGGKFVVPIPKLEIF